MKEPLSNEGSEAVGYLAATHDRKWYPLLRDAAERNTRDASYLSYAAELGGEEMLPLLVGLEKGSDTFANLTGIMAMGSTGTRAVIPILLDELQNPDTNVRDQANGALQELTHRTPFRGSPSQNGRDEYFRWPRWWEREGATAPIYTASECGPLVPLP